MDITNPGCFVNPNYQIAPSVEDFNLEYIFDLENRQMCYIGKSEPELMRELRHDAVARNYFDFLVGTPEKLMKFVRNKNLSKALLASLLDQRVCKAFLASCALVEKEVTEDCGNSGDPCLEDGCAFEGTGGVCLNAVLLSEGKCTKLCIDIWIAMFQRPENRIEVWRK